MKKTILLVFLLLLLGAAWYAWNGYGQVYESNVSTSQEVEFHIYPGQEYEAVLAGLQELQVIDDLKALDWVAQKKSYPDKVKPGRYILKDGMSNNELVNMLRSGAQNPIRISFNNARNLEQLAGKLSSKLALDSLALIQDLRNPETYGRYGFRQETFLAMFVPDTYEVYWTISSEDLIAKMAGAFKNFWTQERIAKAKKLGLSQSEVVTLASIVQAEQSLQHSEWPTIAGLYLNRIRRGMNLESDPTLIYAAGDFSIRRVLNKHKKIDSPYNTYKNPGLPPGPIRMPDKGAVDAVLNAPRHEYIFMCAKADLSGFHNFSKTLREHNRYARAYRQTMNQNRIYR